MRLGDSTGERPSPALGIRSGVVTLALALAPAVSAIWAVPCFVTQDGPAHVYNAHILLESLRLGPDSPFASVFEPNWRPLPNLGGHLALMGMLSVLPPRAADRAMTTISLAGFAFAILWLRWRVAGPRGLEASAVLAALLAINMPWLMGFSNFLLGASLAVVTWGVWWGGRDRLGPGRAGAIGALLVLGYLGHLVSLGLAVAGLVVLAVSAPAPAAGGRSGFRRRLGWTLLSCAPVVPMAVLYKALTAEGGAFEPTWEQSGSWLSPVLWARRVSWIDPIALGRRDIAPVWSGMDGPWCLALAPSLWLGLGLLAAIGKTWGRPRSGAFPSRRAWTALAILLLVGSAAGPDGFGEAHGYYLAQRVALLGLAALVPALDWGEGAVSGRLAAGLIGAALALQSAFVWDFALESNCRAGALLASAPAVGRGERVGTLLVDIRGRYRSNPLLHADCLLGVGSGNVVWSNYEPRHYYFPVQLLPDLDAPPSQEFEDVALSGDPSDRRRRWEGLIGRYGGGMDVVLCWGLDPGLEPITAGWAGSGPVFSSGKVRVYRRSAVAGITRGAPRRR
ncbi:hypothetical protein [Tautonia sociabilis]|uniref:Glycosyltransferase RgtA/B/C/D-like domain-containing protein n=1 Tax=Tautonia sociabilis TaxID=2080755 RepID=A0A432MGJ6_9BACT|nr:hypothetical protein [Tautonia sociabilis]RUL85835.1 hypothetical protein TsocGM_17605 [Tautonia sociabilis]